MALSTSQNISTTTKKSGSDKNLELLKLELPQNMVHAMINEAFYMFDDDESGDIDKKEFTNLIKSINPDISKKKIEELMKSIDRDGSGKIEKGEFTEMMLTQFGNLQNEQKEEKGTKKADEKFKKSPVTINMELVFNYYDKDMDGRISYKDFVGVSEELIDKENFNSIEEEEGRLLIDMAKMFWKQYNKNKNVEEEEEDPDSISRDQFLNLLLHIHFLEEQKLPGLDLKRLEKKDNTDKTDNSSSLSKSHQSAVYKKSTKVYVDSMEK